MIKRRRHLIWLRIPTLIVCVATVLFFGGVYNWLGNCRWWIFDWSQSHEPGWVLKVRGSNISIGDNWSLVIGALLAALWLGNLVPALRGLDDRIQEIGELHQGPKRYKNVFRLSIWLTLWLWGVGLFIGTVGDVLVKKATTGQGRWFFPWDKVIDPGILIGTLLGTGTIFALILAFAEVREHLTPRALSFKDALRRSTRFITKWRAEECDISLCAYYPFIGAVNQASYQMEYKTFCAALKEEQVKCICLNLIADMPQSVEQIAALGKGVEGQRPASIQQAIAAFANMWYGEDPMVKFCKAMKDISAEYNYLRDKHDLIRTAQFVPDFHFLLATKQQVGTPAAAFILIPLRPAGMPASERADRPSPPMVGMEVLDADILRGLFELFASLPSTPTPGAATA